MMLTEIFKKIKGREAKHSLHMWIDDSNVLDPDYTPRLINPNQDYFQLRMSEMFLADGREYTREFVPVAVVMSDFLYYSGAQENPRREVLPFLVGPNQILGMDSYTENAPILLRNIKVQGWAPYRGDDIGIFVGLYRMQINDLVDNLLNVVQGVSDTLSVSGIGDYLKIARTVSTGLATIVGMDEIEFRTGGKDEFQQLSKGKYAFRSGYRVYLNATIEDFSANQFWVKDGELFYGDNRNNLKRFDKQDYCLLKIEATDKRTDYELLDFHRTWLKAHSQVLDGNFDRGHALLIECATQISQSPDLIEEHQDFLVDLYLANFEKSKERHAKLYGKNIKVTGRNRSVNLDVRSAGDEMLNMVRNAKRKGIDDAELRGLASTARNIDKLFDGDDGAKELDSKIINQQLDKLKNIRKTENINERVSSVNILDVISAGSIY